MRPSTRQWAMHNSLHFPFWKLWETTDLNLRLVVVTRVSLDFLVPIIPPVILKVFSPFLIVMLLLKLAKIIFRCIHKNNLSNEFFYMSGFVLRTITNGWTMERVHAGRWRKWDEETDGRQCGAVQRTVKKTGSEEKKKARTTWTDNAQWQVSMMLIMPH